MNDAATVSPEVKIRVEGPAKPEESRAGSLLEALAGVEGRVAIHRVGPAFWPTKGRVQLGFVHELKSAKDWSRQWHQANLGGGIYDFTIFDAKGGPAVKHREEFPGEPLDVEPRPKEDELPKRYDAPTADAEVELSRQLRLATLRAELARAERAAARAEKGEVPDAVDVATKERLDKLERMIEKLTERPAWGPQEWAGIATAVGTALGAINQGKLDPATLLQMQSQDRAELLQVLLARDAGGHDPVAAIKTSMDMAIKLVERFSPAEESEKVAMVRVLKDVVEVGLPKLLPAIGDAFRKKEEPEPHAAIAQATSAPTQQTPRETPQAAKPDPPKDGLPSPDQLARALDFIVQSIREGTDPMMAAGVLLGTSEVVYRQVAAIPDVKTLTDNLRGLIANEPAGKYRSTVENLIAAISTEEGRDWTADFLDVLHGREEEPEEPENGDR